MRVVEFDDVVKFHGHVCPGLAMGFRAAELAVLKLGLKPDKEDLVALVENNSCAVDAIQVVTGCTYGKGNLIVDNFGKQVYTIVRRPQGEGIRIAVHWIPPSEDEDSVKMMKRFMEGDRSTEVMQSVKSRKAHKAKTILETNSEELFKSTLLTISLPERARVYPTVICQKCGEKTMEPMAVKSSDDFLLCIPCSENE